MGTMDNETRIALENLQRILADLPTARALNAYGSQRATEKKQQALVIIERALAR